MEQTTRQEKLELLLRSFELHFDIERNVTVPGGSFPAYAYYMLREEQFIGNRKHVINAFEQYEHAYFYTTEHLDLHTLKQQIDLSRKAGLQKIVPHKEHMRSYVTLIILADVIDADATAFLKRYKFRKSYRLSLHGWMEYHIAAMELSTTDFISNPAGKEVRKTLQSVFNPKGK